jgi:hypothetical protein
MTTEEATVASSATLECISSDSSSSTVDSHLSSVVSALSNNNVEVESCIPPSVTTEIRMTAEIRYHNANLKQILDLRTTAELMIEEITDLGADHSRAADLPRLHAYKEHLEEKYVLSYNRLQALNQAVASRKRKRASTDSIPPSDLPSSISLGSNRTICFLYENRFLKTDEEALRSLSRQQKLEICSELDLAYNEDEDDTMAVSIYRWHKGLLESLRDSGSRNVASSVDNSTVDSSSVILGEPLKKKIKLTPLDTRSKTVKAGESIVTSTLKNTSTLVKYIDALGRRSSPLSLRNEGIMKAQQSMSDESDVCDVYSSSSVSPFGSSQSSASSPRERFSNVTPMSLSAISASPSPRRSATKEIRFNPYVEVRFFESTEDSNFHILL